MGISKITSTAVTGAVKTFKGSSNCWETLLSRGKKPLYNDEMTALDRVLRELDLNQADSLQVQKMKTKNGYAIAHVKGDKWDGVVSIADLDKGGVVKFRGKAASAYGDKAEMSGFLDLSKKSGQKDTFICSDKTGKTNFDMSDGKSFSVHGELSKYDELPETKAEAKSAYDYIGKLRNKIKTALQKEEPKLEPAPTKNYPKVFAGHTV